MNILVVSSYLPFPLLDGGSVRLYNIIKELSKRHKITLICEIRPHQTDADIQEMKKLCEDVLVVKHRKPWSRQHLLRTTFSTQPLLLVMHTFPEMKKYIVETLNAKLFDVIHVETSYVFQNLPKTYLPVVLVEHNIEYKVYERYAQKALFPLRPLLLPDITKIKYWEEKFWKQATKVVAVSKEEQEQMKGVEAALVPNGVDIQKFKFAKSKNRREKRVLFIGNFKWIQNQQAALKILTDIWPKVMDNVGGEEINKYLKLWIVGKHIPENIKAYASKSIVIDENAPDETEKIYQQSDILLAPLEVGGGSSYKILEAMASGVPVVTTELGINGVAGENGVHALVGKSDEKLAQGVSDLLRNGELSEKIKVAARKFVEQTYNWQVIAGELEKVYKEAIEATL